MAHSHGHQHVAGHGLHSSGNRDERYRETIKVTLVGSVIDLLLGLSKISVGFISHSQALVADGIHSLSDLATDFMVLYAAKHASREADEEHPYGHGRIETIATVALGIALIQFGLPWLLATVVALVLFFLLLFVTLLVEPPGLAFSFSSCNPS